MDQRHGAARPAKEKAMTPDSELRKAAQAIVKFVEDIHGALMPTIPYSLYCDLRDALAAQEPEPMREYKTTDYCAYCGCSPEAAQHGPFEGSHDYVPPEPEPGAESDEELCKWLEWMDCIEKEPVPRQYLQAAARIRQLVAENMAYLKSFEAINAIDAETRADRNRWKAAAKAWMQYDSDRLSDRSDVLASRWESLGTARRLTAEAKNTPLIKEFK